MHAQAWSALLSVNSERPTCHHVECKCNATPVQVQVEVVAAAVGERGAEREPLDTDVVHESRADDEPVDQVTGAVADVDAVVAAAPDAADALPAACSARRSKQLQDEASWFDGGRSHVRRSPPCQRHNVVLLPAQPLPLQPVLG